MVIVTIIAGGNVYWCDDSITSSKSLLRRPSMVYQTNEPPTMDAEKVVTI